MGTRQTLSEWACFARFQTRGKLIPRDVGTSIGNVLDDDPREPFYAEHSISFRTSMDSIGTAAGIDGS